MAYTSLPFPAFRLVLCVYFLWTTAHAGYVYNGRGFRTVDLSNMLSNLSPVQRSAGQGTNNGYACSRGDTIVRVGTEWNERCRQCICTEAGTQCTGPTCALPYDSMQEIRCAKWTDACCCAELGCMLGNGTVVPVGGVMPFDPARPCQECTCMGANRTSCLMQTCWPPRCVDGVEVQGQCCPSCPNGRTCFLPEKEARTMSPTQLRSLSIVRELSPVVLRAETPFEISCSCEVGRMLATCRSSSSQRGPQSIPN